MPFIHIAVAGPPLGGDRKSRLHAETTRLMAEVMGKRPDLTSVRIVEGPADAWAVAGTADGGVRAHMDITITAGTNTAQEKASMVRAGHDLLGAVVGALPEATYVVIHELPADAWGYGGLTQGARQAARTG